MKIARVVLTTLQCGNKQMIMFDCNLVLAYNIMTDYTDGKEKNAQKKLLCSCTLHVSY